MPRSKTHWGEWLAKRIRVVGYRSQRGFAEAVGCSPEHLSRWVSMDAPPKQMLKGFDRILTALLKTDRITLFSDFGMTAPESAPIVEQSSELPETSYAVRRRVLAMVELMPDDGLQELARVGEQLLRSGHVLQVA